VQQKCGGVGEESLVINKIKNSPTYKNLIKESKFTWEEFNCSERRRVCLWLWGERRQTPKRERERERDTNTKREEEEEEEEGNQEQGEEEQGEQEFGLLQGFFCG
jgi:hypothetical protein